MISSMPALAILLLLPASAPSTPFIIMRGGPRSIACAGDVNGDGRPDVAFGRDQHVVVVSGVDGTVVWKKAGTQNDRFGCSVASFGDVNGDGVDDLLVGARGMRRSETPPPLPGTVVMGVHRIPRETGSVHVLSGADGTTLRSWTGREAQEAFGYEVRSAGDVDGDGHEDAIVGAPDRGEGRGSAEVFSGRDGTLLWTLDGVAPDAHFGTSVSGAGDVDGDGHADLVVGSPGFDATWDDVKGGAWIYSGKTGELIRKISPLGCAAKEERRACRFGISVSDAGDLDRDGFADVIVGADAASSSCGNAWVFKGSDGSVLRELGPGGIFSTSFGSSVTSIPDVNEDGQVDLVVSDPAFFEDVQAQGKVAVFSGADGALLWTVIGERQFTMLGRCVERSLDMNGDSIPDVLTRGTSIRVLSGKDGTTLLDLSLSELSKEPPADARGETDDR